jgi:hypothetical protein
VLISFQIPRSVLFASKLHRNCKYFDVQHIVRSNIFKLLGPCDFLGKEPESWNLFEPKYSTVRWTILVADCMFECFQITRFVLFGNKSNRNWKSFDVQKTGSTG